MSALTKLTCGNQLMKFKKTEGNIADVDMTPLIDVVFQLIAFFMVISNFEQTQADERVKLPQDQLAKPAEVPRDNELVLNVGFIREGGEIQSEEIVFYVGDKIPVPQFQPRLKFEAQNFKATGVEPKDVTIVIRADREAATGSIQDLIRQSQEEGFSKFALKAAQEPLD